MAIKEKVVIASDFDVDQLSSNCNGPKLKRIYQAFNSQNGIHNPTEELLGRRVPFWI